jgi:hypothetical protein
MVAGGAYDWRQFVATTSEPVGAGELDVVGDGLADGLADGVGVTRGVGS